jgi:ribose-phosphate pyrophosphokinase
MKNSSGDIKFFAGTSGLGFAKKMSKYLGITLGDSEVIRFSDGNIFVRIKESVRDKDVYLVQPIALDPNNEFVEILFWMDAFSRASANSVTAIIPFFSYAKGDKKDEPRVSIRARVCAESIELAGADRVVMMDLHSAQVQGFFKIPLDHLNARQILCEHIKRMGYMDDGDAVVVSPDAGFAKNARMYADYLGVDVAIGDKARVAHDEKAKCLNVIGEVTGKTCIIVDDFSISGETLREIAVAVKEKGAKRIIACLSHVMLKEKGVSVIENSPIELLMSTDTVPNPYILASSKIKIISVAPLFAEAIHRIHSKTSISSLFDALPDKIVEPID